MFIIRKIISNCYFVPKISWQFEASWSRIRGNDSQGIIIIIIGLIRVRPPSSVSSLGAVISLDWWNLKMRAERSFDKSVTSYSRHVVMSLGNWIGYLCENLRYHNS